MVGADPLASALQLDLEPSPSDDAVLHFRGSPPTARLSLRNNTAQLHGFVIAPRVGAPAAGVVFSPRSGLVQPDATVDVNASLASTGISNGEATHVVLWRRVAKVEALRITSPAEYFERSDEAMLELARSGRGTPLVFVECRINTNTRTYSHP